MGKKKTEERMTGTGARVDLRCMLPVWTSRRHLAWPDRNTLRKSRTARIFTGGSWPLCCGMANLAAFEGVEGSFPFKRCLRQGSVEAAQKWRRRYCGTWTKNLAVNTATGQHELPFAGNFEIFCFVFSRDGKCKTHPKKECRMQTGAMNKFSEAKMCSGE